ncbi:MAG TPA: ABC transporter permease [Thermomicrobiales bacterium]
MFHYLLRRLLISIPTLFGVTILIFIVMRLLPGDPTSVMFGQETFGALSEADQQRFRQALGLDEPLYRQYLNWMGDVFSGDLGRSFWRTDTVRDLIVARGPISAQIAIMAIVFSWIIGIPLGIISAVRRNTWPDNLIRATAAVFLSIPEFWLAVVIVLVGVLYFSWRPPVERAYLWEDPWKNLQLTLGPAVAMGSVAAAYLVRITRSSILEVLHADFVRTARAKGLRERLVLTRHVFRAAILPVITLSGLTFAGLLGGSVVVETAFSVPGLGAALVKALSERDYIVIQNLVLLYAVIFTVMNLVVDLAYGWLDPRVRYE